jgi:hypothetical protein
MPTPTPSAYASLALLRKRFTQRTDAELCAFWESSYTWACMRVNKVHLECEEVPPLLVAAMFLYMQYLCEGNLTDKAAYLFSAYELLAVFR